MIDLVGPVSGITSGAGEVFTSVRGDTTRVVIIRADGGGAVTFRFMAGAGATVLALVIEVAAPDNTLREDLAAYSLSMVNDATP